MDFLNIDRDVLEIIVTVIGALILFIIGSKNGRISKLIKLLEAVKVVLVSVKGILKVIKSIVDKLKDVFKRK